MWSPDTSRRALLAALGAALAGCGFTPVYGTGSGLRGQVALPAPQTPFDYRLRAALEDRLGRAEAPRYALSLTATQTSAPGAEAADGSLTRTTLIGTVAFRLVESATQTLLAEGSVDAFSTFSTTGSTVATAAAATDAEERLAVLLADLLLSRLLASLPQ